MWLYESEETRDEFHAILDGVEWVYKQNTKDEIIQRFSRTSPEYDSSVVILAAVASAVKEGHSLTPADVIVIIDQEFLSSSVKQCTGRVRRSKLKQPAEFTESYRLVSTAPWAAVQQIMVLRQQQSVKFKDMMMVASNDSSQ